MNQKNIVSIWIEAAKIIQDKIGPEAFETWFSTIGVKERSPNILIIEAPDEFFKNWIVEHYDALIKNCLQQVSATEIKVEFAVSPEMAKDAEAKLAGTP